LAWAVGFGLLGVALAAISDLTIVDLDLYHEMSPFREMLSLGRMPLVDSFAYTPTVEPVVHHEWGTGAVLYLLTVSSGFGAPGLMVLKYILSFGVCLGCLVNARRRGASMAVFAFLSLFALALGMVAFSTIRAQLFTLVFLVILLFILDGDRRGRTWYVYAVVPLIVVWTNMHGGVVTGVGLLGIYGLDRFVGAWRDRGSIGEALGRTRHLVYVGLGSLLLLNVTPYGWDYLPYLWRAIRMDRPLIPEWLPIWQEGHRATCCLFVGTLMLAGYGTWRRGLRPFFEPLALLISAWLAAWHLRHISI
jgi:hypothetical protein